MSLTRGPVCIIHFDRAQMNRHVRKSHIRLAQSLNIQIRHVCAKQTVRAYTVDYYGADVWEAGIIVITDETFSG